MKIVSDHPVPKLGPEDILVKVRAVTLNPTDWKVRVILVRRFVLFHSSVILVYTTQRMLIGLKSIARRIHARPWELDRMRLLRRRSGSWLSRAGQGTNSGNPRRKDWADLSAHQGVKVGDAVAGFIHGGANDPHNGTFQGKS